MVNISKKKLKGKIADQIHNNFIKIIVRLEGKKGSLFIEELFTPAEKIVFAKRLAALLMLEKGLSSYKVERLLNLSSSTTARMKKDLHCGKYPSIKIITCRKKENDKFWKDLESFIRLGMPEMGKNRWKWLDDVFVD